MTVMVRVLFLQIAAAGFRARRPARSRFRESLFSRPAIIMMYSPTMKKASWILAFVFGSAFVGATLFNADLIAQCRAVLAKGVLREKSAVASARYQLVVVIPDRDDSFFS